MNVYLKTENLPQRIRTQIHNDEVERQTYYQRRNAAAAESHRKKRRQKLAALGINPDSIKSLIEKPKS